jgi:hypothetical protein
MNSACKLLDTPEFKQEIWMFDTGNTRANAYLPLFYIEEIRVNRQVISKQTATVSVCNHGIYTSL